MFKSIKLWQKGLLLKNLSKQILPAILILFASGCAASMAISGKEQKDFSKIVPGMSRDDVLVQLGTPDHYSTEDNGLIRDQWFIVKGNAVNKDRARAHLGLDVLTLGFWEFVGPSYEGYMDREKHTRLIVTYDKKNAVKTIEAIKQP